MFTRLPANVTPHLRAHQVKDVTGMQDPQTTGTSWQDQAQPPAGSPRHAAERLAVCTLLAGSPRLIAIAYFALGDIGKGRSALRHYSQFAGNVIAGQVAGGRDRAVTQVARVIPRW
jgi:hypothetical protein